MPLKTLLILSAAIALAGCTTYHSAPAPDTSSVKTLTDADLDAFVALMIDVFETAPNDPDNNIRDQRVQIDAPALDGAWVYYQLNTGEDRKVYRQRVIHLSISENEDALIQRTYGLNEPASYVDAWQNPALLSALTKEKMKPYFEDGCNQVWRRDAANSWKGYVDPTTCSIFSERRQSHISIEAEAQLDETSYRQTERGFDANGNKLFGTAPGELIVLYRQ